LATVEWVAWFNDRRLHGALGDLPPNRGRRPLRCLGQADTDKQQQLGNHQTRSPQNPVRLRPALADSLGTCRW
jgi:hypothetical protein